MSDAPLPQGPTLSQLFAELGSNGLKLSGDGDTPVSGITQDSRRVAPGDLFVARVGGKANGLSFVDAARAAGAVAILTDAPGELELPLPTLQVEHARLAMGLCAERIFGSPSRALSVVGITGTNGKTTSAWLCQRALEAAGVPTARLGTLGFDFGEFSVDSPLTTPEADVISGYLAQAVRGDARAFVMEVSSHALDQRRADAIHFRVAVFTNLTQDHLDYHASFEEYAEAKARLFLELSPEVSVIHVGDAFGEKLADRTAALGLPVIRVGRERGDVSLSALELGAFGMRGVLALDLPEQRRSLPFASRLVGEHNVENLLCAVGVALALRAQGEPLDLDTLVSALKEVNSAPGRLERCDSEADDLTVLVDYAHTPDALSRALNAVRGFVPEGGRLWCVFGCGGDRDPGKRPKMGDAVGRLADRVVVTNDNPRSESPQAIADMILPGLAPHAIEFSVILDRKLAIDSVIAEAAPHDVVLIAGKGHEPYQLIGDQVLAFDDRLVAADALTRRRETQAKTKDAG
ncbi:MAG: UDP-N-acetylmuramoyl-L-alanyl-D-glutamate--2,6-diaminopimelate ligase [Polyangiaceae bacterium]